MQGAFIQALTYSPPTVLGRQLRPFSSWHGLLLEAAGAPDICGGQVALDDLLTSVWFCSHDFEDGIRIAGEPDLLRNWGKSLKKLSYTAELAEFAAYISAGLTLPQYWQSKTRTDGLRAPFWWHCASFAMRELHLPEDQAWDFPLTRIVCHQACLADLKGNKDLKNDEEIKGLATLRADAAAEKQSVTGNPQSEIK